MTIISFGLLIGRLIPDHLSSSLSSKEYSVFSPSPDSSSIRFSIASPLLFGHTAKQSVFRCFHSRGTAFFRFPVQRHRRSTYRGLCRRVFFGSAYNKTKRYDITRFKFAALHGNHEIAFCQSRCHRISEDLEHRQQ